MMETPFTRIILFRSSPVMGATRVSCACTARAVRSARRRGSALTQETSPKTPYALYNHDFQLCYKHAVNELLNPPRMRFSCLRKSLQGLALRRKQLKGDVLSIK